jgi:ribosomal protein L29
MKMKIKQIRAMSKEEKTSKLLELRTERIKLNSQVLSGANMKNPAIIRNTKKSIARLLQELQKEE